MWICWPSPNAADLLICRTTPPRSLGTILQRQAKGRYYPLAPTSQRSKVQPWDVNSPVFLGCMWACVLRSLLVVPTG